MDLLNRAYKIAVRDLRACYAKNGILAGLRRFDDYWARDSFFASLGSLELKDYEIVKKNLDLFLRFQKKDGQLPRRIDRYHVFLKYWGIKIRRKKLYPIYTTSIFITRPIDQNSLFIISLEKYIQKTRDIAYLRKIFPKVKLALEWNFNHYKNGLLCQGLLADWQDTTFRRGHILYGNVLHYGALLSFANLLEFLKEDNTEILEKARKLKEKIQETFWNGKFFSSWPADHGREYFSTAGNALAIIFGITTKEQANSIEEFVKEKLKGLPLPCAYPRYSLWRYAPLNFLRGNFLYHSSFSWIWLGCLNCVALQAIKRKKDAFSTLQKIAETIVKYGKIYEVYYKEVPVIKKFFKADVPFAWSAGLFVYAYHNLKNR